MKSEAIHSWLQGVEDDVGFEVQTPYEGRGKPRDHDHAASNKPQMFTYAEWERKRNREGTACADVVDSPILAPKPRRCESVKLAQRPSTASSSKARVKPEIFEGIDSTGKRVLHTEERILFLDKAEKVDPSGRSTTSNCPTVTGRSRDGLSRSNALRRSPSPFMGDKLDHQRDRKLTIHPAESLQSERPRMARLDYNSYTPKSRPSTSHASPTVTGRPRGLSRSNAIRRPSSPFAGNNLENQRADTLASHPVEGLRPERPRVVHFDTNSYSPKSRPSTSHASNGLRPETPRVAASDTSSHTSRARPSKFKERL